MKNFLLKFKYLLIGLGLALTTTAYAINVTVPQSTGLGDILRGNANGTYTPYATGSEGTVLKIVSGVPAWSTDLTGGSGSVANGISGYVTRYTGTSTITTGILLDNATVAGANATSSTVTFLVQGTTTLNPFQVNTSTGISIFRVNPNLTVGINTTTNASVLTVQGTSTYPTLPIFTVASSSGTSFVTVAQNGSTTLSTLGTGPVYSVSGALYNAGTTGTGLVVQQTSPTLITPILGVASGTALTLSNNLWVDGTARVTGTSTLATTSIPALSNLTSNGFVKTSGGNGLLSVDTSTYLTGNQTITLSGDVSGSGETSITTAIGNDKVTEAMLKVVDTPTDEDILTYESTTGDFEWHTPAQLNIPNYSYASSSYATLWNLTPGSNITITTTTVPTIAVSSTPTFTTLSTGQGQYELYAMDQDVLTSSSVTFAKGIFTNASTTGFTASGNLYFPGLSNGCLQVSSGVATSTGVNCGSGSGNSAWTLGSGLIYNATSTDSVLIGTSTPTTATAFIQGSGSKNLLTIASSTGSNIITISPTGLTTFNNNVAYIGDIASSITVATDNTYDLGASGNAWANLYIGTGTIDFNNSSAYIQYSSNRLNFFGSTSGYTFDTNVGIATTTPGNKLVVVGTATFTGGNVGIGTNTPTSTLHVQGTGATTSLTISSSTGATMFQIGVNGNIGISTTTPAYKLTVVGTAGNNDIFNVATSTGTSILQVTALSQILACPTCRLTIPQGTAPTLSAVGDIAVDTSNGGMFSFYANGRENVVATTTKSFFISSPTASESHKTAPSYTFDVPVTITKVRCLITSDSNTPSWTFSLPHSTSLGTASANAMSSGQACTSTTTPQTITIGGDLTLAAGEVIWATSSAVTTASTTQIWIDFKYDN